MVAAKAGMNKDFDHEDDGRITVARYVHVAYKVQVAYHQETSKSCSIKSFSTSSWSSRCMKGKEIEGKEKK